MKKFAMLFGFGAFLFMAAPAHAGKVNVAELQEMAEEAINSDCAAKIGAKSGDVGQAWKNMRSACKALRQCKRSCRKAKRAAKKDCRRLKGKAKKDCKKAARRAKRSCKAECRGAYRDNGCKTARRAFWNEIKDTIREAGPACARDAQSFFNGN